MILTLKHINHLNLVTSLGSRKKSVYTIVVRFSGSSKNTGEALIKAGLKAGSSSTASQGATAAGIRATRTAHANTTHANTTPSSTSSDTPSNTKTSTQSVSDNSDPQGAPVPTTSSSKLSAQGSIAEQSQYEKAGVPATIAVVEVASKRESNIDYHESDQVASEAHIDVSAENKSEDITSTKKDLSVRTEMIQQIFKGTTNTALDKQDSVRTESHSNITEQQQTDVTSSKSQTTPAPESPLAETESSNPSTFRSGLLDGFFANTTGESAKASVNNSATSTNTTESSSPSEAYDPYHSKAVVVYTPPNVNVIPTIMAQESSFASDLPDASQYEKPLLGDVSLEGLNPISSLSVPINATLAIGANLSQNNIEFSMSSSKKDVAIPQIPNVISEDFKNELKKKVEQYQLRIEEVKKTIEALDKRIEENTVRNAHIEVHDVYEKSVALMEKSKTLLIELKSIEFTSWTQQHKKDLSALIKDIKTFYNDHEINHKNHIFLTRDLEEYKKLFPIEFLQKNVIDNANSEALISLSIQAFIAQEKIPSCYTVEQHIAEINRLREGKTILENLDKYLTESMFLEIIRRSGIIHNNDAQAPGEIKEQSQAEGFSVKYETFKLIEKNPDKYVEDYYQPTKEEYDQICANIKNKIVVFGAFVNNSYSDQKLLESSEEKHIIVVSHFINANGDKILVAHGFPTSSTNNTAHICDQQYVNADETMKEKKQRFQAHTQLVFISEKDFTEHEVFQKFFTQDTYIQDNGEIVEIYKRISDAILFKRDQFESRPIRFPHVFDREKLRNLAIDSCQAKIEDHERIMRDKQVEYSSMSQKQKIDKKNEALNQYKNYKEQQEKMEYKATLPEHVKDLLDEEKKLEDLRKKQQLEVTSKRKQQQVNDAKQKHRSKNKNDDN